MLNAKFSYIYKNTCLKKYYVFKEQNRQKIKKFNKIMHKFRI